ncbi:holo-[acyl-carrier protein] synthase [Marinitoga hydrogenitolerans DSM 16785]|uniref:Holo-[acyl-carrier-protein] synthase n=1 Tax=Marinitoga hydrogenitolerans (strain DSM 16785 / JCM 12826 / AT1271) TaxID=1122195 RepID=A0A1M4XQL5_MARH1|nr:holo-ACP synthase [Marinitoga hydrogenitolerans]SHE95894.1 holo-[acyl-carrier protein] synthase [Marinitoga hydrogenitolerans DSM 16785]
MIKGIGIDIVEIKRISCGIEKKILSEKEMKLLNKFKGENRKKEFIAGRFAVKEALIKSFGTFIPYNKISILNDAKGKPYLDEKSLDFLKNTFGNYNIHISISHEKNYAVSMVIIEGGER